MAGHAPRIATATVLWTDLDQFARLLRNTPLSRLAPILNRYYSAATEEILAHGGHVVKFMGDSVMGLFNAPHRCPEPELQAVTCALSLQRRVAMLRRGMKMSAGIATGPVLAGDFGHRKTLRYDAFGVTVVRAIVLERYSAEHEFHICLDPFTYDKLKNEIAAEKVIPFSHPLLGAKQKAYRL
ncbi:MAG: adenylate/guanylate cyclase domain-containing protein [Planctomycetes bacterium]|nr:adenylate/guanylate cyclase domain-containing protein [Planctomycetota bacterium]